MSDRKTQILIVEDDAVTRRGLARMFREDEFQITQIGDGEHALQSIARKRPDLIICDYRLPGVDGVELLKRMNQHGNPAPFILITAYSSDELWKEAKAHGAAAIIEKPIELKHLKNQCEKLLGKTVA